MNFLLCISLLLQTAPSPAELGNTATDLFLQGEFGQAAGIFQELFSRMPHNGRIAYNLAAAGFLLGSYADADSLLGMIGEGIGTDTLNSATAISDLALAIQYEDYGGVEAAVEALRGNVSSGDSPGCDITALEAGINWLDNHEPPEDQDQQQNQDQQQDQDQQDQEQEDQDQQQDQDQDQEQEDQDQQQDQDQQDEEQDQEEQQTPPSMDEMTPEQAQAILDLVEESQPQDSVGIGKAGYPAGPVW